MTRFKFFGFLLPLAIAGGLALGLSAAPAQAHCDEVRHTGDHPHCDSDDNGRSDNTPGTMGLDNDGLDAFFSDCNKGVVSGGVKDDLNGNQCYFDGEDGATVGLGEQRPARLSFGGRKSRRNRPGRELTLDLSGCVEEEGFTGCSRLKDILGLPNVAALENVTVDGFVMEVRPYASNCPDGAIPDEGECGDLNVFTMDREPENSVPMGLWIYMNGVNLELEFASRIDPRSSIDPGRGAEVCFGAEATPEELASHGLTDVMVTAFEDGEFVNIAGQNNSWEVEADGGTALLYFRGKNEECIAKVTGVSFLMRAERLE